MAQEAPRKSEALISELRKGAQVSHVFSNAHESAIPDLEKILKTLNDYNIRSEAVRALANIGTRPAHLSLINLIGHSIKPNEQIFHESFHALSRPAENLQEQILALDKWAQKASYPDILKTSILEALVNAPPSSASLTIVKNLQKKKDWKIVELEVLRSLLRLQDASVIPLFQKSFKTLGHEEQQSRLQMWIKPGDRSQLLLAKALIPFFESSQQGPYLGRGHGDDPPERQKHATMGDLATFTAYRLAMEAREGKNPVLEKDFLRNFSKPEKIAVEKMILSLTAK